MGDCADTATAAVDVVIIDDCDSLIQQ